MPSLNQDLQRQRDRRRKLEDKDNAIRWAANVLKQSSEDQATRELNSFFAKEQDTDILGTSNIGKLGSKDDPMGFGAVKKLYTPELNINSSKIKLSQYGLASRLVEADKEWQSTATNREELYSNPAYDDLKKADYGKWQSLVADNATKKEKLENELYELYVSLGFIDVPSAPQVDRKEYMFRSVAQASPTKGLVPGGDVTGMLRGAWRQIKGEEPQSDERFGDNLGRTYVSLFGRFTQNQTDELLETPFGPLLSTMPILGSMAIKAKNITAINNLADTRVGASTVGAVKWGTATRLPTTVPGAVTKIVKGDPIRHIQNVKAQYDDMIDPFIDMVMNPVHRAYRVPIKFTSRVGGVLSKIAYKTGFSKPALHWSEEGLITNKDVRQTIPLPGNRRSMAVHDVVEFSERYAMDSQTRAVITAIRNGSRDLVEMAKAEGLNVPKRNLKESDWQYLHRVTKSVKKDEVDIAGRELERLLTGRVNRQLGADGTPETQWEFVERAVNLLKNKTITSSPEIDVVVSKLADTMIDVSVHGQNITKMRIHELVIDGLKAGVKYDPNPISELNTQARIIYKQVGNQRVGDYVHANIRARVLEGFPELMPQSALQQTLTNATKESSRATKFKEVVQKLWGGRQELSGSALNSLKSQHGLTDEYVAISNLVEMDTWALTGAISRISQKSFKALGVTRKQFKDLLLVLQREQAGAIKTAATKAGKRAYPKAANQRLLKQDIVQSLKDMVKEPPKPVGTLADDYAILEPSKLNTRAIVDFVDDLFSKGTLRLAKGPHVSANVKKLIDQYRQAATARVKDARTEKSAANLAVERKKAELLGAPHAEAVGIPGISGRIVEGQYWQRAGILGKIPARQLPGVLGKIPLALFRGKYQSGPQIVSELKKIFAPPTNTAFDYWVLKPLGAVSTSYRFTKASFDIGMQFIQLQALMGVDAYNLLASGVTHGLRELGAPVNVIKPTAMWPKATANSIKAFINPRHELNYFNQNIDVLGRMIENNALVQVSEFLEGTPGFRTLVKKFPILGKHVIDPIFGGGLTRSQAAWTTGRTAGAVEFWKSAEVYAAATGNLPELGMMTNLVTGVFSLRRFGVTARQSRILNAGIFFAPRYTAAQFAILKHLISNPTSYTGKTAYRTLAAAFGFNTVATTLMALALEQKPAVNPLPKRLGGDGSDLWTVGFKSDSRIGFGGMLYAPLKAVTEIVATAYDDPGKLKRFDESNPAIRTIRGKIAGSTRYLWDYATGRDFMGEQIRNFGNPTPNRETWNYLKKSFTPIWADPLWKDGWAGTVKAMAEFAGLRAHPVSMWKLYRDAVETADDRGRPFIQIDIEGDEKTIRESNASVKELYQDAMDDSSARGWNERQTEYFFKRDTAKAEYWEKAETLYDQMRNESFINGLELKEEQIQGRLTGLRWFKNKMSDAAIERNAKYNALDQEYADVLEEFEKSKEKKEKRGEAFLDNIVSEYWNIVNDPEYENQFGETDYAAKNTALADFGDRVIEDYGQESWDKVSELISYSRIQQPYILQEMMAIHNDPRVREYMEVEKEVFGDDYRSYLRDWKAKSAAHRQAAMVSTPPWVTNLERAVTENKEALRIQDAILEQSLYRWGYVDSFLNQENIENQEQLLVELRPWISLLGGPYLQSSPEPELDELRPSL